ncbi:MAG: SWIM zinc finger family protein [Limnochordia bacterium]|jgi:uncharacterized Zn finger protein
MSRDRYRGYYPPSKPREAKGGIKAQSRRGGFAANWWAKRWLAVLENFNIGARLARGRAYARQGQVLDIQIREGQVQAKVQGSRSTPYKVSISVKTLDVAQWDKVLSALSERAAYAAGLLAGEMPQDIEDVFAATKVPLFPQKAKDLVTDCSCPDWSNPCKHIAAVYYLIGEEFDRDPFLLLLLRGMTKERLVSELQKRGAADTVSIEVMEPAAPESESEPLQVDASLFWHGGPLPGGMDTLHETDAPAALLRRLGPFPLWRGEQQVLDALLPVYLEATERAKRLMS